MIYQICIDPDDRSECRTLCYMKFKRNITKIGVKRKFPYFRSFRKCYPLRGTKKDAMRWLDKKNDRRKIDKNGSGVYDMVQLWKEQRKGQRAEQLEAREANELWEEVTLKHNVQEECTGSYNEL